MSGLRLIAAAPTAAQRRAVFGGDEDLDEGGSGAARALRPSLPHRDPWICAPSRAARQTAAALGVDLAPDPEPGLADPDYGRWTGRTLDDIAAAEPAALQTWLTDPAAAPHGGESLTQLTARAGAWLDAHAGDRLVAVAHPVLIRAALTHALRLHPAGIRQLEVAPLSITRLVHRGGLWHLHLPAAGS